MVDLKLHTIMQTFVGSQSFKGHVSSCITPCGTYVISSSQDGAVYVWNADNGAQVLNLPEIMAMFITALLPKLICHDYFKTGLIAQCPVYYSFR